MSNASDPWIPGRGLSRLLAQENNISDVIQLLSDRDSSPWTNLVGFAPDEVEREARRANNADLLLTAGNQRAVIEVKLGHLMTAQQQERYEALKSKPDLYLAALASDEARIAAGSDRWFFLGLSDLVSRWKASTDPLARMLANETAQVLDKWDSTIAGVFASKDSETRLTLSALDQKFLARVAARRIAHDLAKRSRLVWSGVTNGGQAQVQAWAPIRGEGNDRAFMAEVRWQQSTPSGELRFGVDFGPRPGSVEDEEVRRAAYELAVWNPSSASQR